MSKEELNRKIEEEENDDDHHHENMYEYVKLKDMMYNEKNQMYQYQCPCGDLFEIYLEDMYDGEDVALCPSCTLKVKVIFTENELPELIEYSSSSSDEDDSEEEVEEEKVEGQNGDKIKNVPETTEDRIHKKEVPAI